MSATITPQSLTAYLFPEDKETGPRDLCALCSTPVERWHRWYAFTRRDLAEAIVQANKGAPQHVALDRSQTVENKEQHALALYLAENGVEVTVLTSPEGEGYISHTKGCADANADCWEGSWNASESASRQVNTAFRFVSPQWRDLLVAQFKTDVAWAWANEQSYQVMPEQPAWLPAS